MTYSLNPVSRCGDVRDLVVLDTARRWSPHGVQSGGGFIVHNQVGGRWKRHCTVQQASTYMTVKATPTAVIRFPLKAFLISLKYLLKTQSLRLLADLSSDAS